MVENLYSIFTFEPLHKLHLGRSRLMTTCMVQHLSSYDTYSNPGGLLGKQKRLSSVEAPLIKACIGIPAQSAARNPDSGLLLDFVTKEQTPQLHGLLTDERLEEMMERKNAVLLIHYLSFLRRLLTESLIVSRGKASPG